MIKWTQEALETAQEILGNYETVTAALPEIRKKLEFFVNKNNLELAFYRNDLGGPVNYLKEEEYEYQDEEGDIGTDVIRYNERLVSQVVRLLKQNKYNKTQICSKLKCSSNVLADILDELYNRGFAINYTKEGIINFDLAEAKKSPTKLPPISITEGFDISFATCSDPHFGSKFSAKEEFKAFVKYIYDQGIRDLFIPGDIFSGIGGRAYHPGYEYELEESPFDSHLNIALDTMIPYDGLKYYFISGNHDRVIWKQTGLDACRALVDRSMAQGRDDLIYLGPSEAKVQIGTCKNNVKILLAHPEGVSSTVTISHAPQKYFRGLNQQDLPDVVLAGHMHKASKFTIKDVIIMQVPAFEWTTDWMRQRGLFSTVGGYVVNMKKDVKLGQIKLNYEEIIFKDKRGGWEIV